MLLILLLVSIVLFTLHIVKSKNAFITIDFFQKKNYMLTIVLVFLTFGIQSAFSFVFSFLAQSIYQVDLSVISIIMLPAFIVGAIVGVISGKLTIKLGVQKIVSISISLMVVSLLICIVLINIIILGIVNCLFTAALGLLYAPLVKIVVDSLPAEKVGTGLGFYNLSMSIAASIMIAITGRLISIDSLQSINLLGFRNSSSILYSNILMIFVAIVLSGLILFYVNRNTLSTKENGLGE